MLKLAKYENAEQEIANLKKGGWSDEDIEAYKVLCKPDRSRMEIQPEEI